MLLFIKLIAIAIFVLSEAASRCRFGPVVCFRIAGVRLNDAFLHYSLNDKRDSIAVMDGQALLYGFGAGFLCGNLRFVNFWIYTFVRTLAK